MAKTIAIDERWLEALKLYLEGSNAVEIAEKTEGSEGTIRRWMGNFKDAGIIDGSYSSKSPFPPKLTDAGLLEKAKREMEIVLPDEGGTSRPKKATSKAPPAAGPIEKDIPPQLTPGVFSAEDIEILREMVEERRGKEKRSAMRSGEKAKPTSVTPDGALWTALREWAKREGISTTEAVNQAIEALLGKR